LIASAFACTTGMEDLSRTRTTPQPKNFVASSATCTSPIPSTPSSGPRIGSRICVVCGKPFVARRPEARACSGRCRMNASRARRVGDLVVRIEAAEARLEATEEAVREARAALAGLRELAALGASKVMP